MADDRTEMIDPHRNAGNVEQIPAPGVGFRRRQFRILARDLREAVMGEVEIAEPARRQEDHVAAEMRRRDIEPARAERSGVAGLVQQREQEDEQDPLRQHQHRPERHAGNDQTAEKQDRAQMQRQLRKPRRVRCLGQLAALRGRQAGEELLVIHGGGRLRKGQV
jgi:hypothetical protein